MGPRTVIATGVQTEGIAKKHSTEFKIRDLAIHGQIYSTKFVIPNIASYMSVTCHIMPSSWIVNNKLYSINK